MESLFQNITLQEMVKLVKPPKRSDIIKEFVERLNKEILEQNQSELDKARRFNYKPIIRKEWKPAYIAFRLSHIKHKDDLYFLLSMCKDSKSFGKYFWWSLKTNDK